MSVVLLLGLSFFAQEAPDPAKIDAAVKKGIAYLRTQEATYLNRFSLMGRGMYHRELVLWTLLNGEVPPTDALFQKLFDDMLKDKLEATYSVALQAMVLEFLDRVRFQVRIAMCAKFLVDNQGPQGHWSYGSPSIYVEDVPYDTKKAGQPASKPGPLTAPQNPKVMRKIPVKKDRDGEGADSSNTFIAALGMRACHDAGIVFEPQVIDKAIRGWKEYGVGEKTPGWTYDFRQGPTYPTATAGAVASWVICGHIQGVSKKKDASVLAGLTGLGQGWDVKEMPGLNGEPTLALHHYALYSIGVAATLAGAKKLGDHDYYAEGVKALLEQQNADGSWGSNTIPFPQGNLGGRVTYVSNAVWDTCFSILFLRRGIQPIPDSQPAKKK